MTDEGNTENVDELVSDLYRELPVPQTPDHLNRSILQMAAGQSSGSDKFLFASWIKPVAWAATIALSLAIVLDLSELPKTLPGDNQPSAPAEDVLLELAVEDKGKKDSFAASAPAAARPVARKLAAERSDAGRQRSGERVASLVSFADKRELDSAAACDEEARKSAKDWLACIKSLRESGAIELADREYAAFLTENPNKSEDSGSNK